MADFGRPAGDDELILALLSRFAGTQGSDGALFDPSASCADGERDGELKNPAK
jgi:hypothetical protein